MKKIGVYGSLKRERYNHSLLPESEYIGTGKVKGVLYKVSSYPAIVDGDDDVEVELYRVPDNEYNMVHNMEIGAGYVVRHVEINGETFIVFYAGDELAEHCKKFCQTIKVY